MPELPEMETYRNLLLPRVVGKSITEVEISRDKSVNMDSEHFIQQLVGRTIVDVERRAKHLLFHLDSGQQMLLLHLMLGGWMFYGTMAEKPDRTVQVRLTFGHKPRGTGEAGEAEHLFIIGLRLGYLHLLSREETLEHLAKLGPEPMAPHFGVEQLASRMRTKRGTLKAVLTDQSVIAGIGNCYSDEICYTAGFLPSRKITQMTDPDINRLYTAMQTTLREAIQNGGYMDNPFYAGDTYTGGYGRNCKVYDRGNEPCIRCGHPIVRAEVSSKKCFYCSKCQT